MRGGQEQRKDRDNERYSEEEEREEECYEGDGERVEK